MKKNSAAVLLLALVYIPAVRGEQLLSVAEISLSKAMERAPMRYEYFEKAGALGINRKKTRRYEVTDNGDGLTSVVVFADEGRHHSDDPRPPARVGDTAPFDFAGLINDLNPFNPELEVPAMRENGVDDGMLAYTFECITTDEDGSFASTGELFVDSDTGMVHRIRIERAELPEEINSQLWILEFEGSGPEDCKLASRYYESRGKYSIFNYKFRTTDTFYY